MPQATLIYRAKRFSPNSVENDRLILHLTGERLRQKGFEVTEMTEEQLLAAGLLPPADIIFTMTREEESMRILSQCDCPAVINSPSGIIRCSDRQALTQAMIEMSVPVPPEHGTQGIWLKRSKGTAEVAEDTVFCHTEDDVEKAMAMFHRRGIHEVVRQAHVDGDLVKFYGVAHTPFFYHFYPTDTGRSKFGSEAHNGMAHHYPFSLDALQSSVNRLAQHIGVCVYGGDAIVRENGDFCIIDFNDWPTFSPCRDEAADAIASLATDSLCGCKVVET